MRSFAAAPELRDVRGPSALGGNSRRFFELLWLSAAVDFKLRYHGSALGYLWSLLRPLLLFGVLFVVFTQVFRFGDAVVAYPVMLLMNVMLFSFFTDATSAAVKSVVSREQTVRRTRFPRAVLPLSVVLTATLVLLMNLVAVVIFVLAYGIEPRASWLLFPIALAALIAFTACLSLLFAALYVKFRDVEQIWGVLSRALFYGTPVLYPLELAPEGLRSLLALNPLVPILELARIWLIDPSAPGLVENAGGAGVLIASIAIGVAICAIGIVVFGRASRTIAEDL